ncbi:MAG TPA: hypothetical protein VLA13_10740 [Massilibacterium sp.]|nr:hypothetical protein [Massilibacterium sp.]
MRTISPNSLIRKTRARDYVILLEDLEFAMPKTQLKRITDKHNSGLIIEEIAKEEGRDIYEIILALLHQAKTNKVSLRPLAFRK